MALFKRKQKEETKRDDRDDIVAERIELVERRLTIAEERLKAIEAREVEERRYARNR